MDEISPPIYQERRGNSVDIYELPIATGTTLLHPERAILNFGRGCGSIDFGAVCYPQRDFGRRSTGHGKSVILKSLDHSRVIAVRLMIEHLNNQFLYKEKRPATLKRRWDHLEGFIDWCDANAVEINFRDFKELRYPISAYVGDLRRLVQQHKISLNVASMMQSDAISVLEESFGIEDLASGINLLRKDFRTTEPTSVPDDDVLSRVVDWAECLMAGLSEMLLDNKPYPHALRIPKYLGVKKNELWVFPYDVWTAVPGNILKVGSKHVDYVNGRLRAPEEVALISKLHISTLRTHNKAAVECLAASNKTSTHHSRIARGLLAMKSYLILMLATSGQPLGVISALPWSEELEEQVFRKNATRQKFRTIKYRAGGAEITFEVGIRHFPLLRTYLRLRRYLLGDQISQYLFFNFGKNSKSEAPLSLGNGSQAVLMFYKALSRLDSSLSSVTAREFRAAKGDFLIRITDPATAALSMQHSLKTAEKSYYNGSQITHFDEMSSYFKAVESRVKRGGRDEKTSCHQERANGECEQPQSPDPIIANPPATPDCKHPEGCFFCKNYYVHADELDARKLLSARLCITYRISRTNDVEEITKAYAPLLKVISILLDQMREYNAPMLEAVEYEVEKQGILTPYWLMKMETFTELESLI